MAISISIKKIKGVEYVYLIESFRDPQTKRPTTRILQSFGRKEKLLADNPGALEEIEAMAMKLRADSESYNTVLESRIGAAVNIASDLRNRSASLSCTPAPYRVLWEELGMESYFRNFTRNYRIPYDLDLTVFYACLNRIVDPSSYRSGWLNRERFVFDFSSIKLDQIYESLGILSNRKENIIKKLNESIGNLYKRDLTIALYDVTTFYFESFIEDDLRRRGMSKEHRTQETQVVLGLLIDSEGIPLTYELFPGNTAEVHTLLEVVKKFKADFKIETVTIVADSGLNQYINLQALDDAGFKYIVGFPPYIKLGKNDQDSLLDEEGWNWHINAEGERWGFKTLPMMIERTIKNTQTEENIDINLDAIFIGTFSTKRYFHDIEELELKYAKAASLVKKGPKAVAAAGRSGYKSFIKTSSDSVELNNSLYEKRKKWCGYVGLLTNIKDLTPEEIYSQLRQLWRIEENFRIMKTNLEVRPVFVWTMEHIRGHFVLNYIGLVLQKVLQRKLKQTGLVVSANEIVRALESMRVVKLVGVTKASGHLYTSCNDVAYAKSVTLSDGSPMPLTELCDKILTVNGVEPPSALETDTRLRKKLKVRLMLA